MGIINLWARALVSLCFPDCQSLSLVTRRNSGDNYTVSDLKPSACLVPETSKFRASSSYSPRLSNPLSQGCANLSCKVGERVNTFGSAGHERVCWNSPALLLKCNGHSSYVPTTLDLWTLKFEFHLIFMSHQIVFLFRFPPTIQKHKYYCWLVSYTVVLFSASGPMGRGTRPLTQVFGGGSAKIRWSEPLFDPGLCG